MVRRLGEGPMADAIVSGATDLYRRGRHDVDLVVFHEEDARPRRMIPFAAMNIAEAFGYRGAAVATSLGTAAALLRCPGPSARFFYCWDLEWVGAKDRAFEAYASVYSDPGLRLIARDGPQLEILEDCWNARVAGVVENFNIEQLIGIVGNHGETQDEDRGGDRQRGDRGR